MSDFSPTLVLQTSIAKAPNDMANLQIKSEKLTPFGGIFRSWSNLILFKLKP